MASILETIGLRQPSRRHNGERKPRWSSSRERNSWYGDLTEEQIRDTTYAYNLQARVYADTMEWAERWDESMIGEERRGPFYYFLDLLGGPPALVVDVGCGTGKAASIMVQQGYKVIGLDNAPGMIKEANQRVQHPNASFLVANLRVDTCAIIGGVNDREGADGIMCNSALTHIPKTEAAGILQDFYACLKPGGPLFFGLKSSKDGAVFMDEKIGLPRYFTTFSPDELSRVRTIIDEIGFDHITDFSFPHSFPEKPDWRDFYLRKPILPSVAE